MNSISNSIKNSTVIALGSIFVAGALNVLYTVSAVAQGTTQNQVFDGLTESVIGFNLVVGSATVLVVALAFLYFFYNLAKYILKPEEDKNEVKSRMGYALLAIVVITSLWGLVAFARSIIGLDDKDAETIQTSVVNLGSQ